MKRRAKQHDQEAEPPLLTRAEARRFFRVTNATLDRWLEKGKLLEAFSVPSAPPRRPTPVVLYSVCDHELRSKLARKLAASAGEVLAVQLLPEQIQAQVRALRKTPAPRAHKRRPHPGRGAVLEMQGLFHRLAARVEAETEPEGETGAAASGAAPTAPERESAAMLGFATEPPRTEPPRDVDPSLAGVSSPGPAPQVLPAPTFSIDSVAAALAPESRSTKAAAPAPAPEATVATGVDGPAAIPPAAPVPVVAAAAQAIATLMASDAELAMLFGDQGQAQSVGQLQAPEDQSYSTRPASGAELLRSLNDQISGLRNELLWKDRQVATELAELRVRAERPEVAEAPAARRTHRTALTSPSLLAGGIALLTLWPFVLWLRCGDLYWALAALVFANLAACTSLLCARVRD